MSTDRYRNVIIGSGEGGKYLAWHLAHSGQSTVVVERRWRRGCMYPPFRLCCRLMHVAAFYLVFEMWFYVYDADGDGPYKRGSIWESALARLGSRTTIKSTCLQNEILGNLLAPGVLLLGKLPKTTFGE